jgi:hypothetical protein
MEEKLVIYLKCVCVYVHTHVQTNTYFVMPDMARHVSRGLTSCLGPSQKNLC